MEKGCLNIIIQSYDEDNTGRHDELLYCLNSNLNNPYIKAVYDLTSIGGDMGIIHPKYNAIKHNDWLTFKSAFTFANGKPNEYFAILNADIALSTDDNWLMMSNIYLDNGYILAQSRNEYNINNGVYHMDKNLGQLFHAHTQDGWFFKSPIKCDDDCNFEIGRLGCDNAIAHRLFKSGYKLINIPQQYKLFHCDSIRGKTGGNYREYHNKMNNMKGIINKYPEESGARLLPNFDVVNKLSIDHLINMLGFKPMEKYELICDIMTARIKINNR